MGWKKKKSNQKPVADQPEKKREEGWVDGYKDLVKENAAFNNFYKAQGIMQDTEWDTFIESLQTSLPSAFRVVPTAGLWQGLKEYFTKAVQDEGKWLQQIDFVADGLAFQFASLDRQTIRKNELLNGAVSETQKLLQLETQRGGIQRQETVSMIPPALLKVQAGHTVLDMCAAPGSKTSQIIDLMHNDARKRNVDAKVKLPNSYVDAARGEGIVIANEVDVKRAGILAHNLTRLPSATLGVTIQDASALAMLRTNLKKEGGSRKDRLQVNGAPLFDRILADVPCSGDGTLRKNPDVWKHWSINSGMGLHHKQLQILKRGYQLLKPGGRLVYSTCSFNPLENESVVAAFLQDEPAAILAEECLGSVSKGASPFVTRKGVREWTVPDPRDATCQTYLTEIPPKDTWKSWLTIEAPVSGETPVKTDDEIVNAEEESDSEAEEEQVVDGETPATGEAAETEGTAGVKRYRKKNPLKMLKPTMFATYAEERVLAQLHKCFRVAPHDNNSGGFFIAVFDKPGTDARDPTSVSSPLVVPAEEPAAKKAKLLSEENAEEDEEDEGVVEAEEGEDEEDEGRDAPEKQNMEVAAHRLGSMPVATYEKLDAIFGLSQGGVDATGVEGTLNPSLALSRERLCTRDSVCKKVFLSSSQGVKLNARLLKGGADLRWVILGSRVFQRFTTAAKSLESTREVSYRLCQDGVKAILPYLSKRVLVISKAQARVLLTEGKFELESTEGQQKFINNMRGSKQFLANGENFTEGVNHGAIAIVVTDKDNLADEHSELVMAGVIALKRIEIYVTKQDRLAMLKQLE